MVVSLAACHALYSTRMTGLTCFLPVSLSLLHFNVLVFEMGVTLPASQVVVNIRRIIDVKGSDRTPGTTQKLHKASDGWHCCFHGPQTPEVNIEMSKKDFHVLEDVFQGICLETKFWPEQRVSRNL